MKFKLAILFLFFIQLSYAQDLKFELRGKVIEASSKDVIEGANVKLIGSDNSIVEIKTDSAGEYFFDSTRIKPNTTYIASASGLDIKNKNAPDGYLGNPKWKFTTIDLTESQNFIKNLELKLLIKAIDTETQSKLQKPITPPSNAKCGNCFLLQKALETKLLQDWFYLCNPPNEILTIIDTSKFFSTCYWDSICTRKIIVSSDLGKLKGEQLFNLSMHPDYTQFKNILLFFSITNKKNIYTLHFFQPVTNKDVILKLKCTKKTVKLKDYSRGVF